MTRQPLPMRRNAVNFDVEFPTHTGKLYTVTVGFYEDWRIGEVFISSNQKPGTMADLAGRDIALLISIALQHGADIEVMEHAAMKDESGANEGLAGIVLGHLCKLQTMFSASAAEASP